MHILVLGSNMKSALNNETWRVKIVPKYSVIIVKRIFIYRIFILIS